MKTRSVKLFLLGAFIAIFFAGTAYAELAAVGPVGGKGFPFYYKDLAGADGVKLTLCLNNAFCVFDPPIPGNQWSRRVGFGKEAPYWEAHSTIKNATGISADLHLKLQATYGNTVANGNQIVENNLVIRVKGLPVSGKYTVIHPFGQKTFAVKKGSIDFSQIVKGVTFRGALAGPVGPFLRAVSPPPPAGFIGNPNLRQTVTGSPNKKNFFRIIGPARADLGGPAATPNMVTEKLFRLQGQIL